MFKHDKNLLQQVRVDAPNPNYAAMLQEQLAARRESLKPPCNTCHKAIASSSPRSGTCF